MTPTERDNRIAELREMSQKILDEMGALMNAQQRERMSNVLGKFYKFTYDDNRMELIHIQDVDVVGNLKGISFSFGRDVFSLNTKWGASQHWLDCLDPDYDGAVVEEIEEARFRGLCAAWLLRMQRSIGTWLLRMQRSIGTKESE